MSAGSVSTLSTSLNLKIATAITYKSTMQTHLESTAKNWYVIKL